MSIKIYVEGGGDSKKQKTECRKGFRTMVESAGISSRQIGLSFVACGGRQNAYKSFETAHLTGNSSPMLLVDAEAPVTVQGPWEHLGARDGWRRPSGAVDGQCHLMVQVMESWLLADRKALASYYGQHFKENALPSNRNVEQISKKDVMQGLEYATRNTKKGKYSKGSHSFEILGKLAVAAVEAAAKHAKRFFDTLRAGGPS